MALLASRAGSGSAGQSPLGGLGGLVDQFRQNGFEDVVNSWIGTGQNQPMSGNQLRQALGRDRSMSCQGRPAYRRMTCFRSFPISCPASLIS